MNTDPKNQAARPAVDLNSELRTGLNDILSFASLLELHATDRDRESVQKILRAGRQMLDLLGGNLPQPQKPVTPPHNFPPNGTVQNVLYVEDNDANFELVDRILESRPTINLLRADCGGVAQKLAAETRPKLILLDLDLPDMSGTEVLRQLRAQPETGLIPVVIISADATPSQIERLLAAGARNYLTKPFNIEMLLAVVDELLVQSAA